jgi:hypothetical protein
LLPSIDANFSREQYERFRKDWFVDFGSGLVGIREWYQGREKPTQYRPGPVVYGMGAAATGLGIGAARANSDLEAWHKMLRALELMGGPVGLYEKSYVWGQSLLCDTIALWGKTVQPWNATQPTHVPAAPRQNDNYLIAVVGITIAASAVVILFCRRLVRLLRDKNVIKPKLTPAIGSVAVIQLALLLLFLCHVLNPIQTLLIVVVLDMLEELSVRPGIMRQLSSK